MSETHSLGAQLRGVRRELGERGLSGLLRALFVGHSANGLVQFFRYGFVGLAAAIVDTGTLLVLTNSFGVHYLVSGTISFVLGTIVNYVLSVLWVFKSTDRRVLELVMFVAIGVVGLGVNDLVLWLCADLLGIALLWSKVAAIVIGFLWNFAMRKILFDRLRARMLATASSSSTAVAPER